MTGQEIIDKLKEIGLTPREWRKNEYGDQKGSIWDKKQYDKIEEYIKKYNHKDEVDQYKVLETFGPIECVEQFGGEGKGDTHYFIINFIDRNIYLKAEGWYASYEGSNYDSAYWEEVEPVPVTSIQYLSVNRKK